MSSISNTNLTAKVNDGVMDYTVSPETTSTTKRGSNELGKDAFLQLLVAQMQYQDPLEPSDNTEYVAQLAQFSQLEQLQNLSGESEKSQAFSLIGKYVTFKITDTAGRTSFPEGYVDYVNMVGNKIKLSVNGSVYDYENLYMVVDNEYAEIQNAAEAAAEQNQNNNSERG